eukprot:TRINITY_DN5170_c0_g1_i1.p1 TRINITY_DN5170_c0_g1~~TRINITY_DN5170_c0_g1_i1.p1  ORF type:complete len:352 (-),score=-26.23 TRINITY_DN5170_c0_g1_i1:160-1092(-)
MEETHYYPFGLTMAGISSKAAGKMENKNDKFQGQPLDDDLGINWYGFKWRNHDPQIGRFIQVDPLSDKYVHNSTYAFSENKVTNHVELEGLEAVTAQPLTIEKAKNFVKAVGNFAAYAFGVVMAPLNMVGDMHAAGNAKNPVRKAELEQSARNNAALALEGAITGYSLSTLFKGLRAGAKVPFTNNSLGGNWVKTNESMSEAAANFQSSVTGHAANESYLLNGVKFDGMVGDVLVDAKSGMSNFVSKKTGEFYDWFKGSESLMNQATRQLEAANGTQVQWVFQNENVMKATQKLFKENNISGIELIYKPK